MAHRRALAAAALAAATALVVSAAPASAAAPPYVALGDSYSSGTGTRSYIADGTSCLRSVYAYPSLIASAKGYALNFRACSGAKIADVTNTQLSALTAGTAYVTISIGGNDAGFADVLTTCAQPAWLSNCTGAVDKAQAYIRNTLPAALNTLYAQIRVPRPAGQGHRRRLPAHLQRHRLQPPHVVLVDGDVAAQRHGRPPQLHDGRTGERGRILLREPDDAVRRARGVRQPGVDQRPVQPDRRELPPQQDGTCERLHPDREPLRHRCRPSRRRRPCSRRPRPRRRASPTSSARYAAVDAGIEPEVVLTPDLTTPRGAGGGGEGRGRPVEPRQHRRGRPRLRRTGGRGVPGPLTAGRMP